MGLGKTVSIISLILSHTRGKTEDDKYIIEDRDEAVFESKSSLIICPNQLIVQWKKEFDKHCENTIKVYTIITIKDLKALTYQKIVDSDAVIISHQFLKNQNYLKLCGNISTLLGRAKSNKSKIKITKTSPILQHIGWSLLIFLFFISFSSFFIYLLINNFYFIYYFYSLILLLLFLLLLLVFII